MKQNQTLINLGWSIPAMLVVLACALILATMTGCETTSINVGDKRLVGFTPEQLRSFAVDGYAASQGDAEATERLIETGKTVGLKIVGENPDLIASVLDEDVAQPFIDEYFPRVKDLPGFSKYSDMLAGIIPGWDSFNEKAKEDGVAVIEWDSKIIHHKSGNWKHGEIEHPYFTVYDNKSRELSELYSIAGDSAVKVRDLNGAETANGLHIDGDTLYVATEHNGYHKRDGSDWSKGKLRGRWCVAVAGTLAPANNEYSGGMLRDRPKLTDMVTGQDAGEIPKAGMVLDAAEGPNGEWAYTLGYWQEGVWLPGDKWVPIDAYSIVWWQDRWWIGRGSGDSKGRPNGEIGYLDGSRFVKVLDTGGRKVCDLETDSRGNLWYIAANPDQIGYLTPAQIAYTAFKPGWPENDGGLFDCRLSVAQGSVYAGFSRRDGAVVVRIREK